MLVNWVNKEPVSKLEILNSQLGEPSMIVDQPYGAIFWRDSESMQQTINFNFGFPSVFVKHMLTDETTLHTCPVPHKDYFYSYIKVLLNTNTLNQINKLSGSIGYDKVKKLLWARCNCLAGNIVTLTLAMEILVLGTNVNEFARTGIYVKKLAEVMHPDTGPEMCKKIYARLYELYVKHYAKIAASVKLSNQLESSKWSGAFGPNCQAPPGFFAKLLIKDKVPKTDTKAKSELRKLKSQREKNAVKQNKLQQEKNKNQASVNPGNSGNPRQPDQTDSEFIENPEYLTANKGVWYASDRGDWYASNYPSHVRGGWEYDGGFPDYQPYQEKMSNLSDMLLSRSVNIQSPQQKNSLEHLANTKGDSWYAENPWYVSNDPMVWHAGMKNDMMFVPPHRNSSIAHAKKISNNGTEQIETMNSSLLGNHPRYCVCKSCKNGLTQSHKYEMMSNYSKKN